MDYILCTQCHLKEIGDCKVVTGESVARRHWIVMCRVNLDGGEEEESKGRAEDQMVGRLL